MTSLEEGRAAERNLRLVTAALEHGGVEYFLVPGRSVQRYVVGIRLADRKALLSSMRELYAGTALYAAEPVSDIWPANAALYAEGALPTELKRRPVRIRRDPPRPFGTGSRRARPRLRRGVLAGRRPAPRAA
ncbi:hypothetical protein OH782_12380 [Streptomyces sp. NBC_01544]|nr:hypothetical protein OHB17_29550 [Streptomyces sp. NBC_00724]